MTERLGLELESIEAGDQFAAVNNIDSPVQWLRDVFDLTPTGTAPGAAPPSATMRALQPGVFDGSPVMIAVLRCYGGGNTAFDAIAVYDSDKALIGSVDHVMQDDIGETPDLVIENLRSVGNTVIYTMPGLQTAGDGYCHACTGSAEATIDGSTYTITGSAPYVDTSTPAASGLKSYDITITCS